MSVRFVRAYSASVLVVGLSVVRGVSQSVAATQKLGCFFLLCVNKCFLFLFVFL